MAPGRRGTQQRPISSFFSPKPSYPSKDDQPFNRTFTPRQHSIDSFLSPKSSSQDTQQQQKKKPVLVVGLPNEQALSSHLTTEPHSKSFLSASSPSHEAVCFTKSSSETPVSVASSRVVEMKLKAFSANSNGCKGSLESKQNQPTANTAESVRYKRRRLRKLNDANESADLLHDNSSQIQVPKLSPEETEVENMDFSVVNRPKRARRRVIYRKDSSSSDNDNSDEDKDWIEKEKTGRTSEDDEPELELQNETEEPRKKQTKVTARSSTGRNARSHSASTNAAVTKIKSSQKRNSATGKNNDFNFFDQNEKSNGSRICINHSPEGGNSSGTGICDDQNFDDQTVGDGTSTSLTGESAVRFGHREAEKFKFLGKDRRDAAGRRPSDPCYDPRTVYVPADFLRGLSGGQRQWWEFKSKHMDKVLFFKMGKFYEMFEMDAHIGAQELNLQYMKGEQPHCGFPEKNFASNAEKLARKGYRVLVVEQTERPSQLEERKKQTGSKDKVVNREICAVITRGTMTEGEMLEGHPDVAYLMAIFEICEERELGDSILGLCVADTSTGKFLLGQFYDDFARTRLRSVLSELRPVELIKPWGMLTEATERALRDQTRNPLVTNLIPEVEFWGSARTVEEIVKLYSVLKTPSADLSSECDAGIRLDILPGLVHSLVTRIPKAEAVLCALGGCISYLRQALLDRSLLGFGTFEMLPVSDVLTETIPSSHVLDEHNLKADSSASVTFSASTLSDHMILDSTALGNLELLENCDGGTSGTLLSRLDYCVTAAGHCCIRQWIVRPLKCAKAISERQSAIGDLKGVAADAVKVFRKNLTRLPDMQRLLARLHANSEASGRNSQKVVLYEDTAKKQLKEFIEALRSLQNISEVLSLFMPILRQLSSIKLQQLLTPGQGLPNVIPLLRHFEDAFDWLEAEKTGRILPHEGVDDHYDLALKEVSEVEQKLETYLNLQKKHFGNDAEIVFVTVGKDRFQIEVPECLQTEVPADYELQSSRKGFRRYSTPTVKKFLHEVTAAEEQKELALKGILQGLLIRFCERYTQWLSVIQVVAELDALISLSVASDSMIGRTCKPIINANWKCSNRSTPFLHAKGLRHPILEDSLVREGSFVPNDVNLGGDRGVPFILLTGPNMGGKSTLIRQVCLAVILAQMGAYVPAESFQLSLVDRVFVRMGAKDNIMAGQSTFLVELSETASMLSSATTDSLVALDELGRGTATSDGQAIAYAVLQHLAHNIGCRGIFSTHYHRLADEFADNSVVAQYHMGCKVGTGTSGLEEVTFLYKLITGPCPKSYGINVARIAGMPEIILKRAAVCSTDMENKHSQLTLMKQNSGSCVELFQELLEAIEKLLSACPISFDLAHLRSLWKNVRRSNIFSSNSSDSP